jgi:malonate-semialdehyde dehydrogenase (acetylating)/methylmalonate-semialdehyde dehydrogenase
MAQGAEMGPVVTQAAKQRIEKLIGEGVEQGATLVVDGRGHRVAGFEKASSWAAPCSTTCSRR